MAKVKQQDIDLLKKKKLTFSEKLRFTWRQVVENKINYLMLAPFLIFFFLFTVLPVGASMVLSFTRYDILNNPVFIGWDNYLRMFLEDDVFIIALKNTLMFAVITGPVS